MNAPVVSLLALLTAIVASCTSRVNVGVLAVALAWAAGAYAGRTPDAVLAGFPASLFVTLAGVTLLFGIGEVNGTVGVLTYRLLATAAGRTSLLPAVVFAIACFLSTVGPGAIASVAFTAPLAMALAARARIGPFLMALMVGNGANAGNLSPVSSVGIIANTRMAEAGLGGHQWKVWAANFAAHALVAAVAWLALARREMRRNDLGTTVDSDAGAVPGRATLSRHQRLTAVVIALWIAGAVFIRLPIGLSAFTAAALLLLLRVVHEGLAIKSMPWAAIMMVCGMTLLVALVERTGGMDLFTALIAKLANPSSINGVIAFVTGLISSYSSTSAVVLPTFLPMAPGLVQQIGGGDPLAVALSINVGASLVDVSPLSTLGALCVAALPDADAARDLFRKLLIWGLSMSVVGALLCLLFASSFARL